MIASNHKLNKKSSRTIWGELEYLCAKIHHWLHKRGDKKSARRFQSRLNLVLAKLPENDLAILREEGLSLLYELRGEIPIAIVHRKREIKLMERLHESVKVSVKGGEYDPTMGKSILANRDRADLKERRVILKALEAQEGEHEKLLNAKVRRRNVPLGSRGKPPLRKERPYARKRPA